MNNLSATIRAKYNTLSKGQKKIADFLVEHYDKAAFMTAGAIGQTVNVSESTVVRCATELGFDGYPELQKQMQEMIKNRFTSVQRMESASQRMTDDNVIEKVLSADMELIRETLHCVNKTTFNEAVTAINQARNIYVIGVRSSAPLASFLAFYLNLIYDNVILVDTAGSSERFESLFRINQEDVCIAITFPRYSKQTINSLHFVSQRHTKIIAITDSVETEIASLADCLLIAKSDMVSFVDSLVAPLSVINALIVAASRSRKEEMYNNLNALESIWDQYQIYEKDESND